MRLGPALSICASQRSGYDTTTTSWQLLVRGSYSASPWTGTTSAGGSGSRSLTEATNPPTVGTSLNGKAAASFNGTSQILSGAAVSTYCSTTAVYGCALVNVAAIATNIVAGNQLQNAVIWTTSGTSQCGVYLRDPGASPTVGFYLNTVGSGLVQVETAISKNAWQFVKWKWNGTTFGIGVNGGAFNTTTIASTTISSLSAVIMLARGVSGVNFLSGQIEELKLTGSGGETISDATFDNERLYMNSRYGLSL